MSSIDPAVQPQPSAPLKNSLGRAVCCIDPFFYYNAEILTLGANADAAKSGKRRKMCWKIHIRAVHVQITWPLHNRPVSANVYDVPLEPDSSYYCGWHFSCVAIRYRLIFFSFPWKSVGVFFWLSIDSIRTIRKTKKALEGSNLNIWLHPL